MVATLGEAHDLGWSLRARCGFGTRDGMKSIRECIHSYDLDLPTLVCTRGREFPLSLLASRLRCPRCGSRAWLCISSHRRTGSDKLADGTGGKRPNRPFTPVQSGSSCRSNGDKSGARECSCGQWTATHTALSDRCRTSSEAS
jgi:hypothetical protein